MHKQTRPHSAHPRMSSRKPGALRAIKTASNERFLEVCKATDRECRFLLSGRGSLAHQTKRGNATGDGIFHVSPSLISFKHTYCSPGQHEPARAGVVCVRNTSNRTHHVFARPFDDSRLRLEYRFQGANGKAKLSPGMALNVEIWVSANHANLEPVHDQLEIRCGQEIYHIPVHVQFAETKQQAELGEEEIPDFLSTIGIPHLKHARWNPATKQLERLPKDNDLFFDPTMDISAFRDHVEGVHKQGGLSLSGGDESDENRAASLENVSMREAHASVSLPKSMEQGR